MRTSKRKKKNPQFKLTPTIEQPEEPEKTASAQDSTTLSNDPSNSLPVEEQLPQSLAEGPALSLEKNETIKSEKKQTTTESTPKES